MSYITYQKGRCPKCGLDLTSRSGNPHVVSCNHCGYNVSPSTPRVIDEPKEAPKITKEEPKQDPRLVADQTIYISAETWGRLCEYSKQNPDIPKYDKSRPNPSFNDIIAAPFSLTDKHKQPKTELYK